MLLFRTGIKPLTTVNRLVFDNFVNLKTNFKIPPNDYVFNSNPNKHSFNFFTDVSKKLSIKY